MTLPLSKPSHTALPPDTAELLPDADMPACMPARHPLDMPTQALGRYDKGGRREAGLRRPSWRVRLARLVVFGGTLALTACGAYEMHGVLEVGGVTSLEWVLLILFVTNFSWISLALMNAVVGLASMGGGRGEPQTAELSRRTAVIVPAHNEDPARVFGALAAIIEEIAGGPYAAQARHFDWFVLSDTTDPDIWVAEERVFVELRRRLGGKANVYYRHRPKNVGRKAGNIADFVGGWGGGERPGRRHHPDTAADRQPQHHVRAAAAVRRPHLWSRDRHRPVGLVRPRR
jgi:membrane glycosyltransferase